MVLIMLTNFAILLLALTCAAGSPIEIRSTGTQDWIDTWTEAPTNLNAEFLPAPYNASSGGSYLVDTTVRQTMRFSLGTGSAPFRIVLSNEYGSDNLSITAMNVALPLAQGGNTTGSSLVQISSIQNVTFGGQASVNIAAGALTTSDDIQLEVAADSDVSVTMYLSTGQPGSAITGHGDPQQTSWFATGDQLGNMDLSDKVEVGYWVYLTAIEAFLGNDTNAIACVGDSITDGYLSSINGEARYPNWLFRRLQQDSTLANSLAVVDQGISAEGVFSTDYTGTSGMSRIQRDVLSQAGVIYVILLEGVNDLGHSATDNSSQQTVYNNIISAYESIISQSHTADIPIFGGTITPFGVPDGEASNGYSSPERDATRLKINEWIMTAGHFNGAIDFNTAVANASFPMQLQDRYNAGGWLHPNDAGYKAMAAAVDLSVFSKSTNDG